MSAHNNRDKEKRESATHAFCYAIVCGNQKEGLSLDRIVLLCFRRQATPELMSLGCLRSRRRRLASDYCHERTYDVDTSLQRYECSSPVRGRVR
jgi:hypothetical protein